MSETRKFWRASLEKFKKSFDMDKMRLVEEMKYKKELEMAMVEIQYRKNQAEQAQNILQPITVNTTTTAWPAMGPVGGMVGGLVGQQLHRQVKQSIRLNPEEWEYDIEADVYRKKAPKVAEGVRWLDILKPDAEVK